MNYCFESIVWLEKNEMNKGKKKLTHNVETKSRGVYFLMFRLFLSRFFLYTNKRKMYDVGKLAFDIHLFLPMQPLLCSLENHEVLKIIIQ